MNKVIYAIIAVAIILAGVIAFAPGDVVGKAINSISNLQVDDNNILKVSSAGLSGKTMSNPSNMAFATTTLGSLRAGTYYFKVTSVDYAGGQTAPTDEYSKVVGSEPYTGTSSAVRMTVTPTTGASSTRLWVATSSGAYYYYVVATSSTWVATTVGMTSGVIPSANTAYTNNNGSMWNPDANLKFNAVGDTLIKSGPGFVHTVTFSPSDAAATGGSIAILDGTAAGASTVSTTFYTPAAAMAPVTILLDQTFTNGIFVDFTTVADVNVSISYR